MDVQRIKKTALVAINLSAIILHLLRKKKKKALKRKYWVRPMLLQRKEKGHFYTLFKYIKDNDHEQFFKFTRMTVPQFEKLLNLLREPLTKRSIREPLSPEHQLCIAVYYLAHGCSMQTVAWNFYVSKSTVSKIIRNTCKIIWDVLSPIYISQPTTEDWYQYAHDFQELWNMPNCFGAIDGKHIVIQAPYNSGSNYFNYKKTFSIVLMAVCNAKYVFTLVDVGAFGSQSDGGVFKESIFGVSLDNYELGIPGDSCLPGTDIKFPHYLVGDEAFPLKKYIMRPYPGVNLNKTQKIFNYRLSRARRIIENSFGILASRWRIFRTTIIADVHTAEWIVCAGLCLHNFLRISELAERSENATYCPTNYADTWDNQGYVISGKWREGEENITLRNMGRMGANNATRKNISLRDILADYLISPEGAVSWQEPYITRGTFTVTANNNNGNENNENNFIA